MVCRPRARLWHAATGILLAVWLAMAFQWQPALGEDTESAAENEATLVHAAEPSKALAPPVVLPDLPETLVVAQPRPRHRLQSQGRQRTDQPADARPWPGLHRRQLHDPRVGRKNRL